MKKDFMCPICNSAPLITDYCPNCSRIEGHTAPPDAFPQAHRLALELEYLLLSCTDTAAYSKWWDSAHEALEQWRQFCAIEPAPQQHDFYKTGDTDAPEQIKDRNGEVVLAYCRRCKQAEADLTPTCPIGAAPLPDADYMPKICVEPDAWATTDNCVGPNLGKVRYDKLPIQSFNPLQYTHEKMYSHRAVIGLMKAAYYDGYSEREKEVRATESTPLPDAQLCRFYDVNNFPDLVAAMDHHIEKLQAKLPPTPSLWPGRVREG